MPQFAPSVSKTGVAPITVQPSGLSCSAELYLGSAKAATSGLIAFTSTGAAQAISFPITMPGAGGTYKVYLDIFVSGILIAAYVATEDVVIAAVAVAPFIFSNVWCISVVLTLAPSWHTIEWHCTITNPNNVSVTQLLKAMFSTDYGPQNTQAGLSFNLTLAPGQSLNFMWDGNAPTYPGSPYVNGPAVSYHTCMWLEDEWGNKSPEGCILEQSNLSYENLFFEKVYFYSSFQSFHVECDIRNIGNTTITRVVALWAIAPTYYPGVSYRSSWYEVAVYYQGQLYSGNTPTISLTLAPGQVFHYAFVGDLLMKVEYQVQLRDNIGGKSAIVVAA